MGRLHANDERSAAYQVSGSLSERRTQWQQAGNKVVVTTKIVRNFVLGRGIETDSVPNDPAGGRIMGLRMNFHLTVKDTLLHHL